MNARIADFVRTSLTDVAADYDIDAITEEIVDTYGHGIDLDTLEAGEYWTIVAQHDTTAQSENTVTITEPGDLYHSYPGQNSAQPAHVVLDLAGQVLSADYNPEIGNAVPAAVFHGFTRRYSVPALTSAAAAELLQELRPLAERVAADWGQRWDGHNMVAELGGDAAAAEAEIERACAAAWGDDSAQVTVWDLDGATTGDEAEEYGITGQTSDERLDEIEEDIRQSLAEVSGSGEVVLEGVTEYLQQVRADAAGADE